MSSELAVKDSLDVALRVGAALEAIGCAYFVGGSVASSLHGEPRATNDIDFVVAMRPQRVQAFAEQLGPDFEVDTDMLRDALRQGSCASGDRRYAFASPVRRCLSKRPKTPSCGSCCGSVNEAAKA